MKYLKLLAFIFLSFLFGSVSSQYYYFDSGWNTYQQWCAETLDVRINSQWKWVRAWRLYLLLDPNTIIYEKSNMDYLFEPSSETFLNTLSSFPAWRSWSNETVLMVDRYRASDDYIWEIWLYWTINFKPVFSGWTYDVSFWMEYFSWNYTTETTLSKTGWIELINPEKQDLYRTWIIHVLQEPCVADTNKPTITNISFGSTKVSHLSWLTFWLNDNWWVTWVKNVPYIKTDWSPWTWNVWWIISNQYW